MKGSLRRDDDSTKSHRALGRGHIEAGAIIARIPTIERVPHIRIQLRTITRHTPLIPAALRARVIPEDVSLDSIEGAGKTGCPPGTRGSRAEKGCASARQQQVSAASRRPSLRSGLRLIRALLGEPMLVCHRRLACAFGANTRLDASVGAPGPHDFAVRNPCRSSVSTITSTAFRSTFVTTRTPLIGAE